MIRTDIGNLFWRGCKTQVEIKKMHPELSMQQIRTSSELTKKDNYNEHPNLKTEMKEDYYNYWMEQTEDDIIEWRNKRGIQTDEETKYILAVGRYYRTLNNEFERL